MKKSIIAGMISLIACSVFAETDYIAMEAIKKLRNGTTEKNFRIESLHVEGAANVGGALDVDSVTVDAGAGIDTQAAGTLQVGASTATKVEIADVNVDTEVQGDLEVNGNAEVLGTFEAVGAVTIPGGYARADQTFSAVSIVESGMTSTNGVLTITMRDAANEVLAAAKAFEMWFEKPGQVGTPDQSDVDFSIVNGDMRRYGYTVDATTNRVIGVYLVQSNTNGIFSMTMTTDAALTNTVHIYSANGAYNYAELKFIDD